MRAVGAARAVSGRALRASAAALNESDLKAVDLAKETKIEWRAMQDARATPAGVWRARVPSALASEAKVSGLLCCLDAS